MKKRVPVNTIFEANMKALREQYPRIAARVEQAPVSKDYEMRGTGTKRYVNIYSFQKQMYYYDQEDPLQDVAQQFRSLKLKNVKIAVFLGFGLGYEVDYFARNLASEMGTEKILIIEKDVELFKTALNMFNYVPMMYDKKIKLLVGEDEPEMFPILVEFLRNTGIVMYLKAMKPVYHSSAILLHKDYYMSVLKAVKEASLYTLRFYGNDPHDSLIGVEHMLDNLSEIIANPGINLLFHKFENKPAVIVATGPSLNKNKHLLKGLKDKALIIAADASLRILLDMGVKPHLVTSLERVQPTVRLLQGFTQEQVEDVYLAACPVVCPEMYEAYPGPRIIVYRDFDHFRWLGIDRGILAIKHSAGNMAYKVAEALGCNPIILIGQDLAYSREGKTHAAGTFYGEEQKVINNHLEVMGNDGEPILTNAVWNEFRKAYETDIAGYKGLCINSTEGGALIHGTKVMPFQEAIDTYINESFYPLAIIKDNIEGFSAVSSQEDIEKVKQKINSTRTDLQTIMEQCREGFEKIKDNESILSTIISGGVQAENEFNPDELYNEIIGYKKRIMAVQPTMQLFLMHIIQSFHVNFHIDLNEVPDLYDSEDKVKADMILKHSKWFAILHDIIDICINSLNRAEANIN